MEPDTETVYMDTAALAKRWGCSQKTIQNRIASRSPMPPVFRLAGTRFAVADVIAFEASQKQVA